jgi:cell division protein FtsA
MNKKSDKNLIVGLDIGTSKVVAIVGEVGEVGDGGKIEVVGIGSHPSRGLKKGVVVNIESTVHSIQRAVEEAELMAGCDIIRMASFASATRKSRAETWIVSSMQHGRLQFPRTRRSCTYCRRNS